MAETIAVITATYKIVASADQRPAILESLRTFMGPTEVKPGCMRCNILLDEENADIVIYTEDWETEAHLDDHIRSPRFLQLLTIIDMSARQPEVGFRTLTEIKGMEYIEALRLRD
jgi:quinol monooxygenase YgiN